MRTRLGSACSRSPAASVDESRRRGRSATSGPGSRRVYRACSLAGSDRLFSHEGDVRDGISQRQQPEEPPKPLGELLHPQVHWRHSGLTCYAQSGEVTKERAAPAALSMSHGVATCPYRPYRPYHPYQHPCRRFLPSAPQRSWPPWSTSRPRQKQRSEAPCA